MDDIDDDAVSVLKSEFGDSEDVDAMQMRATDDTHINSQGHDTPDRKEYDTIEWPKTLVRTYFFKKGSKTINYFSGVPVTQQGGALNFGSDGKSYNFFTYNPTDEGKNSFENPFVKSVKGTLSNWYAGCEPTCDMLNKLLDGGFFYGYPYNDAIGYAFRPGVKRLVFVFTNEFDNSMTRSMTSNGSNERETVVFPYSISKGSQIKFDTKDDILPTQLPPDPYCLQMGRYQNEIGEFLQSILNSDQDMDEIFNGWDNAISGINMTCSEGGQYLPCVYAKKLPDTKKSWTSRTEEYVKGISSISWTSKVTQGDISGASQLFKGATVGTLLSDEQIKHMVENSGKLPGVEYNSKGEMSKWQWYAGKTIGFYQLRNTFTKLQDDVGIYLMVMDANAPTPLYDTDSSTDFNIFMHQDRELFKEYANGGGGLKTKDFLSASGLKWNDAYRANLYWWSQETMDSDASNTISSADALKLESVIGLQNPYTKNTIVFGYRNNWTEFSKFLNEAKYVIGVSADDMTWLLQKNTKASVRTLIEKWGDISGTKITKKDGIAQEEYDNHIWVKTEFSRSKKNLLTRENMELIAVELKSGGVYKYKIANLTHIGTSKGVTTSYNEWDNCNYIWANGCTDMITIDYGVGNATTGSLKILSWTKAKWNSIKNNSDKLQLRGSGGVPKNFYTALLRGDNDVEYPHVWKNATISVANEKVEKTGPSNSPTKPDFYDNNITEIIRRVKTFYGYLKDAMPIMMAYRFQREIFSQFTNRNGNSLIDYGNNASVFAKAIPITDAYQISKVFASSFNDEFGKGGASRFSYSQCIIDLNPDSSYSELASGEFPITFTNGLEVNVDDEYKKSKILLTKISDISAKNSATFIMGSKASDYAQVTDPEKLKYSDNESIVDGAKDDNIQVTIGNGGSYQKNEKFYDEIVVQETGNKKYFKNKHFFMDPFELTVA